MRRVASVRWLASSLNNMAHAFAKAGNFSKAIDACALAIRLYDSREEEGAIEQVARARLFTANVQFLAGEREKAIANIEAVDRRLVARAAPRLVEVRRLASDLRARPPKAVR